MYVWRVYTQELDRNVNVGQWRNTCQVKDEHMVLFLKIYIKEQNRNVEVLTDVQAPLNAYAQEEIDCEFNSIQNLKTFVSVLAQLGDTGIWHSSD